MLISGIAMILATALPAQAVSPEDRVVRDAPLIVDEPDRTVAPPAALIEPTIPPPTVRRPELARAPIEGDVVQKAITPGGHAQAAPAAPAAPTVPADGDVLEKGDLSYDPPVTLTPTSA